MWLDSMHLYLAIKNQKGETTDIAVGTLREIIYLHFSLHISTWTPAQIKL